jgi:methylthioribose-1-phosphate isomerase
VFVDETRPLLQGARLNTWELSRWGIPFTLICDNMAAVVMGKGRIDCVIVGADRIAANGDTANKVGTYGLACLARAHEVPFYVAAPLSSFDRSLSNGAGIPVEERPDGEITQWGGRRIAARGSGVFNPAFDVTPSRLIAAIVTEAGVMRAPYRRGISRAFREAGKN